MNILIIEDEIMSAEDLSDMITEIDPSISIVSILRSVKEATVFLQTKHDIDLIFSDIQLGDGLSFEIFKTIPIEVPIIFCTAFDEYAIEAFKNNGIDYILKPFDNNQLSNSLNKYKQLKKYFTPISIDYNALINNLLNGNKKENSSILVYQKDKVVPIRLDEIALFYIGNEITRALCFNKKSFIISETLDELEKMGRGIFFRANRQYLINRGAVIDASNYFPRKYKINLSVEFQFPIIISKNKASEFLNWLT